jgi:hypothetical protein
MFAKIMFAEVIGRVYEKFPDLPTPPRGPAPAPFYPHRRKAPHAAAAKTMPGRARDSPYSCE